MCLRRCFSREVSSSDAILDTLHFPQFGPCIAPRNLDFSQNLALSDARCPTLLPHVWPYCTKTCWVFSTFLALLHQKMPLGFSQDFPFSDAKFPTFHIFGPTVPKIVGFSQEFSLLMQIFTCFSTFLALLHQESFNFHRIFLF